MPVDTLGCNGGQVIALFGVVAERAATLKVMIDTRDSQLRLREPLDVARKQARHEPRISGQRIKQFAHAGAEAIDFARLRHLFQKRDHHGFHSRQPLSYLIKGYALALKRLAIDRKISLAAEINLTDSPARSEHVFEHPAHAPA